MASMDYYQNLFNLVSSRSVEATVGMFGISDKALREYLVQELSAKNTRFLADPVFESMFPWEKSDVIMDDLAGDMLLPSLVASMDKAKGHRFGRDWFPFKHQLIAWKTVLEQHKSMVVTSGTGSGKTECFMVPILNDLAQEYEQNNEALVGVRALFIYPLNALINSQRERLRAWTEAYDDGVRFCLYNGNTEENKHREQGQYPHEIMTRKAMRETPAPMLVTNATMLEYMLVRQDDDPIIQQSQGKLRWIVLDEAHTYVGSQAAELSLLLRRVMHTFDVKPEDVRFVATSATISDPAGLTDTDKQLQTYLADLAGISKDQVVIVGGNRSVPPLPTIKKRVLSLAELSGIDADSSYSESRYQALTAHPTALKIREFIATQNTPTTISKLSMHLFGRVAEQEILTWIDVCSNTLKPGPNLNKPKEDAEAFLPVRGHFFHQVTTGLWSCVDKNCSEKQASPLSQGWAFGRVYTQHRNHCNCGAPVYELVFCNDCNNPHLLAVESNGNLIQTPQRSVDEFSLEYEDGESDLPDDDSDENNVDLQEKTIIAPVHDDELTYPVSINEERQLTSPGMSSFDLNILVPDERVSCACCEFSGYQGPFYRRNILGTPFYISNAVPLLLESCDEAENANECPSRGKKLITFTDSRQGTARISAKIQQDSERESIRGNVYGRSAENIVSMPEDEVLENQRQLSEYEEDIKELMQLGKPHLAKPTEKLADDLRIKLAKLGESEAISWNSMVTELQNSVDIDRWISDSYKDLSSLFKGDDRYRILAELLLLREFARRPKRKNSLETLGLVSVEYPALSAIKKMPQGWEQKGATLQDWKDFLKVTLDFYIRENTILDIPRDWVHWMGAKVYPKSVLRYDTKENTSSGIKRWPQVWKGRNNRLIRLLEVAFSLSITKPADEDFINGVMKAAWDALVSEYDVTDSRTGYTEKQRVLKANSGTVQHHLSRASMAFRVCTSVWVCPQTHRLIDTTFRGVTPYLPLKFQKKNVLCRQVKIPVCKLESGVFSSELDRKKAVREWVSQQSEITELRKENLWTDISSGIIEGGKFIRTAEHSAQQPSSLLEKYEALFKKGKVNILNCSTTMEMGVDIGGISVVAMNNVPPHPANYLQRAGRAGRRSETQAVAFTICKDNPHERGVFTNPLWAFETKIKAPYITLSSEQIVQRHVNSVFLASFLKAFYNDSGQEALSLTCKDFFVGQEGGSEPPCERMLRWLHSFEDESQELPSSLSSGVNQVVSRSVLSGYSGPRLAQMACKALKQIQKRWLFAYEKLAAELVSLEKAKKNDPYKRKIENDLSCLGTQYLLSELASGAFLPGYGFPTGIATFDHYSISDYKSGKYVNKKSGRIDNRTRMRERPGRDLPLAIREYAPGSDVVLNGLVYRSAGILMNKFSPNEDYSQPQKITTESRCHICGWIDNETSSASEWVCASCGKNLKPENVKKYIEPAGFAVDFYSSPTNDMSTQNYIPVQEPWVTAGSELMPLFEPKLGSYQASSQGHIFHHSSGIHGNGYAVCLRCGRADSMAADGEVPESLRKDHKKLQGKANVEDFAYCEGSDEHFAIQESIHLGATGQTDIFELHLKYPAENRYIQHQTLDQLPWTLAVALRQALADLHGINTEELGYTVKASNILGCNYPVATVVIFDKAGGGAGFSSSAPRYIREMLLKAREFLDCSSGCETACQTCLLGYDTRFHIDVLNRHVALEYLQSITPYLLLPKEAKFFGESSEFCFESLGEEVIAAASLGSSVKIFTQQSYAEWDISNTQLKEVCFNWTKLFEEVEIALPSQDLLGLDDAQKEDLKALARFGIRVSFIQKTPCLQEQGKLLLQVAGGENCLSIASNAEQSNVPNHMWWQVDGSYLIKSSTLDEVKTHPINEKELSTEQVQGDVEIDIKRECDAKLFMFGSKFWGMLEKESKVIQKAFNSSVSLKKVSYSDCYVCSPWSLILLGECLNALQKKLGDRFNQTEISIVTAEKDASNRARGWYAEWDSADEKSAMIQGYMLELFKKKPSVSIQPMKKMPHGRILQFDWSDGKVITIRLDHGFGCWSVGQSSRRQWFDINAAVEQQIESMLLQRNVLSVSFEKDFATQVFVKIR